MPKRRDNKGIFINTGIYKKCLVCNSLVYVKACHNESKRYCSKNCYYKSKIGKKQSIETVEKRRIKNTGKKRGEETKKKISIALIGENNGSWRGGISKGRRGSNCGKKHREWRNSVFERDKYTCKKCGAKSGCGKKIILNAHHVMPFAYYPSLRFEISNGMTLCDRCHIVETSRERKINWTNQFVKRIPDLSVHGQL